MYFQDVSKPRIYTVNFIGINTYGMQSDCDQYMQRLKFVV